MCAMRVIKILGMIRMRPYFLGLMFCLPMAAGGCARTDDGTVVIPPSMDMRRAWLRDEPSVQTPPVESGTQVFPTRPTVEPIVQQQPVVQRKKQRRPARVATAPRQNGQAASQSSAPIACGEARQADGRVRVTCD